MLNDCLHLITGPMNKGFMVDKAEMGAKYVQEKGQALPNYVGFIDGTMIGIERKIGDEMKRLAYNDHKRKYVLTFQAVNKLDGKIIHDYGPK